MRISDWSSDVGSSDLEIERRQAVLAHVAQAGETVAVLAELAERLHAGVRLAPFDEGALQPAAARRPALARVDALGHLHRRALAHGDPAYFRQATMADFGFADGVALLGFDQRQAEHLADRKSTRLNSSH